MKDKKRKIVLLKSINENMNAVVVNQEIIYSRLEAIIKKSTNQILCNRGRKGID